MLEWSRRKGALARHLEGGGVTGICSVCPASVARVVPSVVGVTFKSAPVTLCPLPCDRVMSASLSTARDLLHSVFGFGGFRPGQEEIVQAVLDGENVLAVMPTGSGKSLCYQLPALVRPGLTLVVSPLIALMRDQVRALGAAGVAAGSLNSSNDPAENARVLSLLRRRELRLLYLAPERLARPDTVEMLCESDVRLMAIDEAHCVSQWGHDFRPEYLTLGSLARQIGGALQTMALTATADAPTRGDIVDKLFVAPPRTFVRSFDRPNLRLAFKPKEHSSRQVLSFAREHAGDSGIVYCASRRKVEELAQALTAAGCKALPYHAGLDKRVRDANQDAFQQEDGVVMTATVAFGMGIDKPDVRFVCHADLPANVEAYYQEIGRAGRDGLAADTLTLYGLSDMQLRRLQIEQSDSSGRAQAGRAPAAQRPAGARRGAALPPPDPARLFRRALRALRQLRPLPGGRRALRRHDRGAEGNVGDPAHRRAFRHGAYRFHPGRRPHRECAEVQSRPPADLRRRQGPAERRMAVDLPPDFGARPDNAGHDGARALVRDRRRPAGAEGPAAHRAAQGSRGVGKGFATRKARGRGLCGRRQRRH